MRDEDVRASCFSHLAILCAQFGDDVPYRDGLDSGFPFRGRRVPYLSPQKGIFRAAVQRGPAALSIQTSANSPYSDVETPDGFLYDYRAGSIDQPDNRALRAAHELQVPLVYFVGTRPGTYRPNFPFFVVADDPGARRVLVAPGAMVGPVDEPVPMLAGSPIERRYAVRQVRVRIHQARFRGRVVPAYRDQCAICRLKEIRLLDAAHIVGDVEEQGKPVISNGLDPPPGVRSRPGGNLAGLRRPCIGAAAPRRGWAHARGLEDFRRADDRSPTSIRVETRPRTSFS